MPRQLIVLVGGSPDDRAAFIARHGTWVVASRDALTHALAPGNLAAPPDGVVERAFAVVLVELLESSVSYLCVDAPAAGRDDRATWIDLARMADRHPVAYVLLEDKVPGASGERCDGSAVADPPTADEGFVEVTYVSVGRRRAKKRAAAVAPAPSLELFAGDPPG